MKNYGSKRKCVHDEINGLKCQVSSGKFCLGKAHQCYTEGNKLKMIIFRKV